MEVGPTFTFPLPFSSKPSLPQPRPCILCFSNSTICLILSPSTLSYNSPNLSIALANFLIPSYLHHLWIKAKGYIGSPEMMSQMVDPELKNFVVDDLKLICEVVKLCIHPEPMKRPSMVELSSLLDSRIDISASIDLKASSLAWAELALSS